MQEYPKTDFNTKIRVIAHKPESKKTIPGAFITTNKTFYSPKASGLKDPRQVKYALFSNMVENKIKS